MRQIPLYCEVGACMGRTDSYKRNVDKFLCAEHWDYGDYNEEEEVDNADPAGDCDVDI